MVQIKISNARMAVIAMSDVEMTGVEMAVVGITLVRIIEMYKLLI